MTTPLNDESGKPGAYLSAEKQVTCDADQPVRLDCGVDLSGITVAYQTYGELNQDKSNAILVCHALTGDQYVAGKNPVTGKDGWWEIIIGPGEILDTDKYYIICPNILGGCMGTTGPKEINPDTGKCWGLDFPVITIADMVSTQAKLLDRLGIKKLFCVIGGSMGGMQVLEWACAPRRTPHRFSRLRFRTTRTSASSRVAWVRAA